MQHGCKPRLQLRSKPRRWASRNLSTFHLLLPQWMPLRIAFQRISRILTLTTSMQTLISRGISKSSRRSTQASVSPLR
jgi:hypothetical protein